MVIVMEKHTAETNIERVMAELVTRGFDVHRSTGTEQTVLGVVGDVAKIDTREFELFDGVQEVVRVSEPYKLSSRTFRREKTIVKTRGIEIGGPEVVVMAGPCTVESETQLFETARRAQYAEFQSAHGAGAGATAGAAETRNVGHDPGVAASRGVHHVGRELRRDSLRTRYPHV